MPGTTTKYGIAEPLDGDFINSWPATSRTALDWLDANISTFITTSPRPAAGMAGRWHRAADGTLTFDTGTTWVEVPWGSVAARLAAGSSDPLTVTLAMIGADVPLPEVGMQIPTVGGLPANGKWAWCDGSLIRADLYPAYYAAQGGAAHIYNGSVNPGLDGSGNQLVRLPNKAGRVSVGAGTATGAPGAVAKLRGSRAGEETHVLSTAELASHTHAPGTLAMLPYTITAGGGGSLTWPQPPGTASAAQYTSLAQTWSGATAAAGSGTAHQNMPPYEVDNWIVRIA